MAPVSIEIYSDKAKSLRLEKHLRKLLEHVPPDHLTGLGRITVVDQSSGRRHRNARGFYRQAYDRHPATIELAAQNIFDGLPRLLTVFPAVVQFVLAQTLYHEIGHHHATRLSHSVSRKDHEDAAERYKAKLMVWAFRRWRPFVVISAPVLRPALRMLSQLFAKLSGRDERR